MKIYFETGTVNPRKRHFDHHSMIPHGDAFIAKMASIQLIEWWWASNCPTNLSLELNHVGHLDDFIALAAVNLAKKQDIKKMRALYKFATQASVIDSCGKFFKNLLSPDITSLIDSLYDVFHNTLNSVAQQNLRSCSSLSFAEQVYAAKTTAEFLIYTLQDIPDPEPLPIIQPAAESYQLIKEGNIAVLYNSLDIPFNVLQMAPFFFQTFDCLISITPRKDNNALQMYMVLLKTPFVGDLTLAWKNLNLLEQNLPLGCTKWGGHAGIGGSPRKQNNWPGGSYLSPNIVIPIIKSCIIKK